MKHYLNITITLIIIGCFFLTGCMTSKADLETAKIEYLDDTYEVQKIECNEQEQYCRIKYKHTQTGAEDYIDTLGVTCDKGDKGEPGEKGEKGDPGRPGPMGPAGEKGEQGERGSAFDYDDFTPDQLQMLKGDKGDPGVDGAPGDSINIEKLTQDEIEHLRNVLGVKTIENEPQVKRYVYEGSFNVSESGDLTNRGVNAKNYWKKIPVEQIKLNDMPIVQVFVKHYDDYYPEGTWQDINTAIHHASYPAVSFGDGFVYILYKIKLAGNIVTYMDGNYKIVVITEK